MKIELTRDQWAAFGREDDRHHDPNRSALQSCCGNISALRDSILAIGANGGDVSPALRERLSQTWDWCRNGHEFNEARHPSWDTLKSVITQAGLPWKDHA